MIDINRFIIETTFYNIRFFSFKMIYFHKYCKSKLEKFDLDKPRWINICNWRK